MIEPAIHTEPRTRGRDHITLDERSMRALELGLAGIALVAALLLGIR